jgi:hypothetical protein
MCTYLSSPFDHYFSLQNEDVDEKKYYTPPQPLYLTSNEQFAQQNNSNYTCHSKLIHVPFVNENEEMKTGPQNDMKIKWIMKSKLNFVLEKFFYVNYFWDKFTTEIIHSDDQLIEPILQTVIQATAYNLFSNVGEHFINNVLVYNWPDLYKSTQEFMIAQITNDNEPEPPQATCQNSSSIPTCVNNEAFENYRQEQSLTIIVDMVALQHFIWYLNNFNPGFDSVNVEFEPHLQSSVNCNSKKKMKPENVIIGQVEQSLKKLKHKLCQVPPLSPPTPTNTIDNKYISNNEDQLPLGLRLSVLFYDKITTFIYEKLLLHSKFNIKLQQIESVKFTLRDVIGNINIYKLNHIDDVDEPKNKILKPGNFKIQTV